MTVTQPAEPADNTFVVWFDQRNDPYATFYRADRYMDGPDDMDRWLNTDQYDSETVETLPWSELCEEMDGFDGPHLLTLVRSESPAVQS